MRPPLTASEAQELRRLQGKWAANKATRKDVMRCKALEAKDLAHVKSRGRNPSVARKPAAVSGERFLLATLYNGQLYYWAGGPWTTSKARAALFRSKDGAGTVAKNHVDAKGSKILVAPEHYRPEALLANLRGGGKE